MPAPTAPARRRAAGDRRDELLRVAHGLARKAGLDALTPADVGAAAHASKALVFHYFGSTVELRRAVAALAIDALDDALTRSEAEATSEGAGALAGRRAPAEHASTHRFGDEQVRHRLLGDGSVREQRAAVVHSLLDAVLAERQVWTDIWAGALRDDEETAARLDEVRAHLFARFTRTVDSTRPVPDDARARLDLLAAGWVGFVEAAIARWLATGRHDRETIEGVVVDSLDGLLAPTAT